MPDIHLPAIYCSLVDKPSVYTREKLRAYKSLAAYNYVVCGHVQTVLYSDIGDDFCVKSGGFTEPDMKWALQTRASLIIALSQSARLIACSHRCRLFFFLNGWDPAGILKNLTAELVRFSQSTTQQVGIFFLTRNSLVNTQFNGMEWTFWPRHAHYELRIFLWREPWRGLLFFFFVFLSNLCIAMTENTGF